MNNTLFLIFITFLVVFAILVILGIVYLCLPRKRLSRTEIHSELTELFRVVSKILNENNVEYFLAYGTLLGKCRHDSIIPWDDDFDLAANERDFSRLQTIDWEKYGLKFIKFKSFHKVFWLKNKNTRFFSHSWPFIDVFTFSVQDRKIATQDRKIATQDRKIAIKEDGIVLINYDDVYPLQQVQFMGAETFIPANSRNILNQMYGENWSTICISSSYDHLNEEYKFGGGKKIPCTNVSLTC